MAEDWQEAAFTSRHIHNRAGRSSGRNKAKGAFDVCNTFGTYTLDAASLQKGPEKSLLEIYRLTPNEDGLVGRMSIPGILDATVLLAGSRKGLQAVVEDMDGALESTQEEEGNRPEAGAGAEDEDSSEDEDDDAEDASEDAAERRRFQTFQKNSFRVPKFWVNWRGQATGSSAKSGPSQSTHGTGYVVFSGNDCRKFRGTISCPEMAWDNASITGWKDAGKSTRDDPVKWDSIRD